MKDFTMTSSNRISGPRIAKAALLPVLIILAAPSLAFAQGAPTNLVLAQASQAAPAANSKPEMSPADRVLVRIGELHEKLHVTPEQESLWAPVAQVMQENETKMHEVISARSGKLSSMTAIEDLKSYEMVADEHADGLKHLIPAFEALYAAMPPAQQKNADHVFDQHAQHAMHAQ
jgi:hypothetical protein